MRKILFNIKNRYSKKNPESAFTIIELSIVIIIIGILASIVTVGMNGATQRAAESSIKNSLTGARTAMKKSYSNEGIYPSTIPPSVSRVGGVKLILSDNDNESFCITGVSRGIAYYINNINTVPAIGSCASYVDPGPDPDPDPDPDPGGSNLAIVLTSNTFNLRAGAGMYLTLSPVSVSGGATPYSYSLVAGSGNANVVEIDSTGMYIVIPDGTVGEDAQLLILVPNAIFEIDEDADPIFQDKLVIVDTHGDGAENDFGYLCSDWLAASATAPLKLVVTDGDDEMAEASFSVQCVQS